MNLVIKEGLIDCYLLLYQPYTWCSNPRRKRSLAKDRDTVHTSTAAQGEKIPPPLPRVRARSRALTLPPPEAPTDRPSQWASDQEWSLFFRKLPFELRQQIYQDYSARRTRRISYISCPQKRGRGYTTYDAPIKTETQVTKWDGNMAAGSCVPLLLPRAVLVMD